MYVDLELIITIGSVLTAICTIGAAVIATVKWFEKQNKQDKDIEDLKADQCMLSYCMLACLDGLKQLGANGEVTKAHNDLSKYLNKRAHDQE